MSDKDETKPAEGMTTPSVETNREVGQTPDQFYGAERPDEAPVPKGHATKGMTILGHTEASRLEDTVAVQEADRKFAEKQAEKQAAKES